MKKEIKKKEVKKIKKTVNNPFATIFKQFNDFINQKFIKYFQKVNEYQTLFTIRDNVNNPIRIILYVDKVENIYAIYVRVNNVANNFYLSNSMIRQDIYIHDDNKVLEQIVFKNSFVKGKTNRDLLRNSYDILYKNISNITEFLETLK